MSQNPDENSRRFVAIDTAYKVGDIEALRAALGTPVDFPNGTIPQGPAIGSHPLEYALFWSPLAMIEGLLDLGADPNYAAEDGFPSLIAALSSNRSDIGAVLRLLVAKGADIGQRGCNDWTPLHYAISRRDLHAAEILLGLGADPLARTRIDDYSTPIEEAEAAAFTEGVALIRAWIEKPPGSTP